MSFWFNAGKLALQAFSAYQASRGSKSFQEGAEAQNLFNAEQARLNREFQERMARNRHQYEVEDLRKAGLNPILSATSGAPVPAGSSAQGVNINQHRPKHSIERNQLLANIASTAKDIMLKHEMSQTEKSKQELNNAQAEALRGTWSIPGFFKAPVQTTAQAIRSAYNRARDWSRKFYRRK